MENTDVFVTEIDLDRRARLQRDWDGEAVVVEVLAQVFLDAGEFRKSHWDLLIGSVLYYVQGRNV
jgi:hypothetical protein